MADIPESTKSRAAFALAASKIDRDARLSDLTDAEIDALIASTRAAPPAMDREAVYRQALEDVCNPLGYLQRMADAEGAKLGGMAYAIASDIGTIQRIAKDALSTLSADAIRQGGGWQPIETAPRDGTWFIADGGGLDRPTPMKWCKRVGAWEADAVMLEDWDQQAEGYSRPLFWFAIPDRLSTADSAGKVWRDIESAPKDGTEIDLWCHVTDSRPIRATDCAWLHLDSGPDWYTRGDKGWEPLGAIGIRPTHWMPFPATPASHASDGGKA